MAFALMLDFARATPTRLAKEPLRYHARGPEPKRLCCYSFKAYDASKLFFSKIISKVSSNTKSTRVSSLSKKSFIGH